MQRRFNRTGRCDTGKLAFTECLESLVKGILKFLLEMSLTYSIIYGYVNNISCISLFVEQVNDDVTRYHLSKAFNVKNRKLVTVNILV